MIMRFVLAALALGATSACGRSTPALETPSWSAGSEDAAEDQRLASEHRAALPALREAESSACAGLARADVDTSPFEHRADVASVTLLVESLPQGVSAPLQRLVGVTITFRRVPGLTEAWLERAIGCHLARDAAAGHQMPEMPDCPLVPAGVTTRVRETDAGLVVEVRGADAAAAEEIARRATRLLPAP